eukprot:TRINITY_DN3983_c0_g1_i4.p1 TRINITY_DN3983_c0_g1~~TRINITY_DN3983_c0_g1_i4.p1  ORF type:complete len:387 (+),score=63.17 TRINITY_DN3983_c0_g1_i4:85-1161(+)
MSDGVLGQNAVFCGGFCITGPDWGASFGSAALIIIPSALFSAFPAMDIADRSTDGYWALVIGLLLCCLALFFLFATTCTNPGIIPRKSEPVDFRTNGRQRPPRRQDFVINGKLVTLKYCSTCRIYRPPRCSHCGICDNCVEMFDHHCPWLGNCIGKRNYRLFSLFLYSVSILSLFVCGSCVYQLILVTNDYKSQGAKSGISAFGQTLGRNPISLILAIYCFVAMFFIGGLCSFHLYLVCAGKTTNEQLKETFPINSQFTKGILRNFVVLFCSRQSSRSSKSVGIEELAKIKSESSDRSSRSGSSSNVVELQPTNMMNDDVSNENHEADADEDVGEHEFRLRKSPALLNHSARSTPPLL